MMMIRRERVHLFYFFARAKEFNNKQERLREKSNSVINKVKAKKYLRMETQQVFDEEEESGTATQRYTETTGRSYWHRIFNCWYAERARNIGSVVEVMLRFDNGAPLI